MLELPLKEDAFPPPDGYHLLNDNELLEFGDKCTCTSRNFGEWFLISEGHAILRGTVRSAKEQHPGYVFCRKNSAIFNQPFDFLKELKNA